LIASRDSHSNNAAWLLMDPLVPQAIDLAEESRNRAEQESGWIAIG
jgi:hypothetical protein